MTNIPDACPTPARSEAAGGEGLTEERIRHAIMYDPMAHAAYTLGTTKGRESADRELTSLRQQLAAAREDAGRLDWMQEHYAEIGWLVPNSDPAVCEVWETHEGVRVIASWSASGSGPDLRSAIDRARTEPAREGATHAEIIDALGPMVDGGSTTIEQVEQATADYLRSREGEGGDALC